MLALIIDTLVTMFVSATATIILFARYHSRITKTLIKEKHEMATESFSKGWKNAVMYVLTTATDDAIAHTRRELQKG